MIVLEWQYWKTSLEVVKVRYLLVSPEEELGLLAECHDVDVASLVVEPVQPQLTVLDHSNEFGHFMEVGPVGRVLDSVIHTNQS